MAGGSDKNWVLEGPTVWQKNFNFAFSGIVFYFYFVLRTKIFTEKVRKPINKKLKALAI